MADLENLLLEAAGRTNNQGGRHRQTTTSSRRRQEGTYSDDGSDSNNDDSDSDRNNYQNRRPSGSQIPLKKRLDSNEKGDDHEQDPDSDRDGDSDDESFGSDLYKDEADRQKLAEMSELKRETILAERAAKVGDKGFREKMREKRRNEKTPQPKRVMRESSPRRTSSRGVRSSARSADRSAAKDDALNELRAKRLKHQDPEAHRREFSAVKRKSFMAADASSSSQSESGSQSDDDVAMVDSDDDKISSDKPTYEDIKGITIRRSKLAKWFMEPFFDELIVGCFVRVGIGNSRTGSIYRLCMVRNVDCSDPDRHYKLDNKKTFKYLNCVWGNESSAARWRMDMISDSPPSKEEFDQWVREVDRNGGRMPSIHDVTEKRDAIQKTNNFVYSAATVKQMLQEKKSATWRPLNVAAEKDRLRREMDVAKSKNDEVEVERIKARLEELDASRQTHEKDSKAQRLAEMNRRNRVENFKNASEIKPVNTGLKAGEAGYDPFSRRWTRSRNYYVSKQGGSEAAAAVEEGGEVAAVGGGVAATVAALEAAADAGKLVDTSAPEGVGTETNIYHNFDLPISLMVLQRFGGAAGVQAGFMARKQKIEATIGCRVPDNDGRRHALTLTVSDYKRRRGLL